MKRPLSAAPTVSTLAAVPLALVAALGLAAACSRPAPSATSSIAPTTSPRPPSPASLASLSSSAPATPPDDPLPGAGRGSLAQRLAAEATGRLTAGAAGPRVEDVAAALRRAGVAVTPPSQVLGRTIGARYCASASTPSGLAVAVCEFADEAGAERGLAYSHRMFDRLIPGRTLLRNRATVLTLSGEDAGAALAADTARVSRVFATL